VLEARLSEKIEFTSSLRSRLTPTLRQRREVSPTNIGQESEAFVAEPIETPQTTEQETDSEPERDTTVPVPVAAREAEEVVPA
jgi:hypothetical protein